MFENKMFKSAGRVGLLEKTKKNPHLYESIDFGIVCLPQHHSEGAEGSASFAQLQAPQLPHPQRQISGSGGPFGVFGLSAPTAARPGYGRGEQLFSLSLVFALCFLQEVGSKKDRLDFEQFHKLYNHIMFEQNEASLKAESLL